jgi:two-component system chemotaxis response regulator CheB
MPKRDTIVIGGSAGAIEALLTIVGALPADLPAAVFVVVHVSPGAFSRLPDILTRAGNLPATHAEHGQAIELGRIYVAPPDRHMLVRQGYLELSRGPRENHSRPAIDPLFRSAARASGRRAIGVILSGALYDGSTGLLALKTRGGVAIVQDPEEAITPSMPQSALKMVDVDHVLPAGAIGPYLARLVQGSMDDKGDTDVDETEQISTIIADDFAEQAANQRAGDTSLYTCPDCGGVMWQDEDGGGFRCHVGHAYASEALLVHKSEELESALWACVRLLREKATLTRQSATRTLHSGNREMASRFEEQALLADRYGHVIRELLEASPNPTDHMDVTVARIDTQLTVSP